MQLCNSETAATPVNLYRLSVLRRHWVVPLSNRTRIGNRTVTITAMQAVLDTGSSVITASTQDANTINSVNLLHTLFCSLHAHKSRHENYTILLCIET